MRVLVCDDEELSRTRLLRLLQQCNVEVVGEAASGRQLLELAERVRPDLVLMDIRMPDIDGLEAAARLNELETPPVVIFCTAYEGHALQAFRVHAADYLLKPVSMIDLRSALERACALNRVPLTEISDDLAVSQVSRRRHLSARTTRGLELVPVDEVRYFQADHKYVVAYHGGGQVLLNEPLKALEDEFAGLFVRIHRSTLVSLRFVEKLKYFRNGSAEAYLRTVEYSLPVSRRYLARVRRALMKRS